MIVQISDIFVVVTAAAIFSIRFFFSIRLLISAFFYPPFTIRIFSSASAIRRYPVRVLQTPFNESEFVSQSVYKKVRLANEKFIEYQNY